jgi:uncharacterized protein YwgA
MVDLSKRLGVFSAIVQQKPGLGKTAMMKYLFILQDVFKVPLGYDFEIYTYGPYSSEVMGELDFARHQDMLNIDGVIYPNGQSGYEISPSGNFQRAIDNSKEFVSKYLEAINKVIELFGDKSAKELELSTTIIYLYNTYMKNGWECTLEAISANVHDIKPHFDIETIRNEYRHLDRLGLLKKPANAYMAMPL